MKTPFYAAIVTEPLTFTEWLQQINLMERFSKVAARFVKLQLKPNQQ